jgi:hypothetical protein
MKKIIVTVALPFFLAWSSVGLAETCYTVEGEVKTVNVSEEIQYGSIELLLLDQEDDEAFRENGILIGKVTGADVKLGVMTTYLSHTAFFDYDNIFITWGDAANIDTSKGVEGVRKWAEDGTETPLPCSFYISEEIKEIAFGTGFFAQTVRSVDIVADGYISNCDGENENEFELTGELCVD